MCETKYIASVSFGKDSLAMLLLLIEKRLPLDEVIFYDTGMEFQAIYNTLDTYVKKYESKIQYIGIALDEPKRLDRLPEGKTAPLAEWNMTESDALAYCYERGYFWEENGIRLYDILDRVSCWCCANKNLKELRNIRIHLPEYWERLKCLQERTDRPMKGPGKSVFELEERFRKEGDSE